MKKRTKLSVQWFYSLLERGECDILDFKEQLNDKTAFGRSLKNFSPKYDETAKDVVAFANNKGGFLFIGIHIATSIYFVVHILAQFSVCVNTCRNSFMLF